jgi:alpha-glucosidase
VDALWISPIYPSPMADFGYDVSSYCEIDPVFGTLADFDRLVAAAHQRGLKIILDYVPNHSSDQHAWFLESRSSRAGPKRDWYVWRDPKPDGSPPNNWLSEFGGPAWTFDQATGQFYYHAYLKEQPDLNWRNPEVREAMLDVLRFWFDRGVDGFRVDAIHNLIEDEQLRDNPPNPGWCKGMSPARQVIRAHTMDQPEVHDAVAAMRRVADAYDDRVLIGEAYLPIDRLMAYYGVGLTGFQLPFNFHLISTPWVPAEVARLIEAYETALPDGAWPNWVLGNHDRSRVASRLGPKQARVAAMLLLTLRGTPTIYQGEEIGMSDVPIPPEQVQDPWEKNVPGLGLGRDPVRTPMPWTADQKAGFTTGEPWLPLGPDQRDMNIAAQAADPHSVLSLYRGLLATRRAEPVLSIGSYVPIAATDSVLAYERRYRSRRLLVLLNMTGAAARLDLGRLRGRVLLSTEDRGLDQLAVQCELQPDEGCIVELTV